MKKSNYKFNRYQKEWIKALESGKYKQGKNALNKNGSFCCLGVACEVFNKINKKEKKKTLIVNADEFNTAKTSYDGESEIAPKNVVKAFKLQDTCGTLSRSVAGLIDLAELNDAGYSFKYIANLIKTRPKVVFKS